MSSGFRALYRLFEKKKQPNILLEELGLSDPFVTFSDDHGFSIALSSIVKHTVMLITMLIFLAEICVYKVFILANNLRDISLQTRL